MRHGHAMSPSSSFRSTQPPHHDQMNSISVQLPLLNVCTIEGDTCDAFHLVCIDTEQHSFSFCFSLVSPHTHPSSSHHHTMPPRACCHCQGRLDAKKGRKVSQSQWEHVKTLLKENTQVRIKTWICDRCRLVLFPGEHVVSKKRKRSVSSASHAESGAESDGAHDDTSQAATSTTSPTLAAAAANLSTLAADVSAVAPHADTLVALSSTAPPPHLIRPYAEALRLTQQTWPLPPSVPYDSIITRAPFLSGPSAATENVRPSAFVAPQLQTSMGSGMSATSTSTSTSSTTAIIPSPPSVDPRQWERFQDGLYSSVLDINNRAAYMERLCSANEKDPGAVQKGMYLSVMDLSITADDFKDRLTNVVHEMIVLAQAQDEKEELKDSLVALESAFPLKLGTHDQRVVSQKEIDPEEIKSTAEEIEHLAPPTYQTSRLTRRASIYGRMKEASDVGLLLQGDLDAVETLDTNQDQGLLASFISLQSLSLATQPLQQKFAAIATAAQATYTAQTRPPHGIVECDHVFSPPLSGFGIAGLQGYLKKETCITFSHDELGWSSALNYMNRESVGCTLWIGFGMHALKQKFSLFEIDEMLSEGETSVFNVGVFLDKLIERDVPLEYLFQKPGQLVSSPAGTGSAHLVIADGPYLFQLAWNHGFLPSGIRDCLTYWEEQHRVWQHVTASNGSMATRSVLPLHTMQLAGYDIGLHDRMDAYERFLTRLQVAFPRTRVDRPSPPSVSGRHCPVCFNRQDWMRVNHKCVFCELKGALGEI